MTSKLRREDQVNYQAFWDGTTTLRMPLDGSKPITELQYPEFYDVGLGTKCDAKCPFCVVPTTLITTALGTKQISDVCIGDEVIVFDEIRQRRELRTVEQLHTRYYEGDLINIELESGEILQITPNHKLLTQRGWVSAEDLLTDDSLLSV